ncbi:MAG: TetR/AcrR family transcriptional regulator [Deltaproteobacteria bacterium]|jgi:AcrR family transcriptional regulator|nr:TetR/AcrR family transcriptional regulator [Deltaproteobacteria bacterium]
MDREERLEKIYDKALEMFVANGYDQTALSQIAKELGLTKAGLYHYFSSKEDLLFFVHERHMNRVFNPILEAAQKISDPEERIVYFIRNYTLKAMTRDASARVLVHETNNLKTENRQKITVLWRNGLDLIRNTLSEMEDQGKIEKINKNFAAFALLGMCSWTFYWFDYERQESGEELADTYVRVFLKGILKAS